MKKKQKFPGRGLRLVVFFILFRCASTPLPVPTPKFKGTVLEQDITKDMTLTKQNAPFLLRGYVHVTDGTILTIEPGVMILGEKESANPDSEEPCAALIIDRGGRIMAEGTAEEPIVFTSNQPEIERMPGDWGGLIINGKAPNNLGTHVSGEAKTGSYGGNNPDDYSGILKYVRIEYGGYSLNLNVQHNGLSLYSVGRKTIVDYIQAFKCLDDGIEIFGGTVDLKHAVSVGNLDDNFDWTDGWQGRGQFWLGRHLPPRSHRGIEADNNEINYNARPLSRPVLFNLTLLGVRGFSDTGLMLRRGTRGLFANSLIMFYNVGLDIDDMETAAGADTPPLSCDTLSTITDVAQLSVQNCILANKENFCSDADGIVEDAWGTDADRLLVTMDMETVADITKTWKLDPSIEPVAATCLPPADGFFEPVSFIGAIGKEDWTAGWTVRQ